MVSSQCTYPDRKWRKITEVEGCSDKERKKEGKKEVRWEEEDEEEEEEEQEQSVGKKWGRGFWFRSERREGGAPESFKNTPREGGEGGKKEKKQEEVERERSIADQ
ncbi:hypothetical protein H6P81_016520 [Aristolochia fimbriata]|uniref:Uncharacterized protein n=1 Tax=Aristolochia fimbriata TaxID=158543 RepID=A0AAV7EAM9_ARIFI|nr:hypothetical protein H6P81_016520 [Aristolochia fimbriata]